MTDEPLALARIEPAREIDMSGVAVRQPLPGPDLPHLDPFLLLHHLGPMNIQEGSNPRTLGVPPHPHRGFEPVTFVFAGAVHHRDSRGNDSIIQAGGVQWMTAGMGIVHSERPPADLARAGGEQEIIQLWINLPSDRKMIQPRYQGIGPDLLPTIAPDEGGGVISVVAGDWGGTVGPAVTQSPVRAAMIGLQAGARFKSRVPAGHNAAVYVLNGAVRMNGKDVVGHELAVGSVGPGTIELVGAEPSEMLFLTGEPLNEPVVTSGPFVMNTHTEVLEAMRDYRMGKMGVLIEEF